MTLTSWKADDDAIMEPADRDFSMPGGSEPILVPAADMPKRSRVRIKKLVGDNEAEVELSDGKYKRAKRHHRHRESSSAYGRGDSG